MYNTEVFFVHYGLCRCMLKLSGGSRKRRCKRAVLSAIGENQYAGSGTI